MCINQMSFDKYILTHIFITISKFIFSYVLLLSGVYVNFFSSDVDIFATNTNVYTTYTYQFYPIACTNTRRSQIEF